MVSLWIVLAATAALELYVLRRLRFHWHIVAIVLAGTVLCVDYLTYTSIAERNHDPSAQVRYIQFIVEHLRLPDVYDCTPCGHPPLYYALAAAWSQVVLLGGWMPLELGLQWLSLLLYFGFVVLALMIFRRCVTRPATLRLATTLLVFWPYGIINSVRVHNDSLATLLMLAAMYFIAEWDRWDRTRDLYAALAASALALLTKSSGYTVAAALAFFAVVRAFSTGFRRRHVQRGAAAIAILAGVAVLAVGFRESRRPLTLCQKVLGHACDGRYVPPIPDTPSRFVTFDVGDFVRHIETVPSDPFLNRLAKSTLFGVKPLGSEFGTEHHEALAMLMSVLLLVMLAGCLAGLPLVLGTQFRKYRGYLGVTGFMFLFLVAFRIQAPNEHHEDFRHIFPALVPFCVGYAASVERLGRYSKVLYWTGVATAVTMGIASVAFFASVP